MPWGGGEGELGSQGTRLSREGWAAIRSQAIFWEERWLLGGAGQLEFILPSPCLGAQSWR